MSQTDSNNADVFCQVQWNEGIESMPAQRDMWEKWVESQLAQANLTFAKVNFYPANRIATFFAVNGQLERVEKIPGLQRSINNSDGWETFYDTYKTWNLPSMAPPPSAPWVSKVKVAAHSEANPEGQENAEAGEGGGSTALVVKKPSTAKKLVSRNTTRRR